MLEYKPKEELIALIKRYEQELNAEREKSDAAPCKPAETVDTPELQRLIEYWRNEPYGWPSFENAWSGLIAHIDQHTARAVAAADKAARQNLARVLGLGVSEPRSFAWDYLFTIVAAALEEQPVAQPVAGELPPDRTNALQVQFERDASKQGNAKLARAVNDTCENGWFPATYHDRATELAWRVYANHPALKPVQQPAAVVGQEPIGYAPTYLTERLDAGDSAVMLTVTRKPLPGHGVTVALYTAPVPAAGVQGDTITLTGHQLRIALELINPDGLDDRDQMDDDLTFGVRQHQDDDGKISTGMCCWNHDTDGVLPLDGEYPDPAKDNCPTCGNPWAEHEFAVPAPYCPEPRKAAAAQSDSGRDAALVDTCRAALQMLADDPDVIESITSKQEAQVRAALAAHPAPSSDAALPEIVRHALEMVDGCMDVTQVEPEDAAAWQIVRKLIAAYPANGAQAGDKLVDVIRKHWTGENFKMISRGEAEEINQALAATKKGGA